MTQIDNAKECNQCIKYMNSILDRLQRTDEKNERELIRLLYDTMLNDLSLYTLNKNRINIPKSLFKSISHPRLIEDILTRNLVLNRNDLINHLPKEYRLKYLGSFQCGECPVCYDFHALQKLPLCTHTFCYKCIKKLLLKDLKRCPMCRAYINKSNIILIDV